MMEPVVVSDVAANVARVRERIAAAAARGDRHPDEITLIAATKGVDIVRMTGAVSAGIHDLGENRVQEAAPKIDALGRQIRWHLIGHLQRNKARQAAALFEVIQSLDSAPLAADLSRRIRQRGEGRTLEVLLQVNVAGEAQKSGVAPDRLFALAREVAALPGLHVVGLMTVEPVAEDPWGVRPVFRQLRALRDELNRRGIFAPPLLHLSMGMSDDFEAAVEEGATMVRIGRAIFGPRG